MTKDSIATHKKPGVRIHRRLRGRVCLPTGQFFQVHGRFIKGRIGCRVGNQGGAKKFSGSKHKTQGIIKEVRN